MTPQPRQPRTPRQAFGEGVRAISSLLAASVVFGLAFGALVYTSAIDNWLGASSSVTMLAGASQFAMVDLFASGAPALVAVGTALVINSRFALYSAALGPLYAAFPARWRFGLAYLMTDQASAISLRHAASYPDPVERRWFFFGAGIVFASANWVGTALGVVLGPVIPDSWQIGFIVPLMFIALAIPTLRDRPTVVAALVSVAVVVLARDLPYGANVLVGALAGVAVGRSVPGKRAADLPVLQEAA